jgi:hypothetical protein
MMQYAILSLPMLVLTFISPQQAQTPHGLRVPDGFEVTEFADITRSYK